MAKNCPNPVAHCSSPCCAASRTCVGFAKKFHWPSSDLAARPRWLYVGVGRMTPAQANYFKDLVFGDAAQASNLLPNPSSDSGQLKYLLAAPAGLHGPCNFKGLQPLSPQRLLQNGHVNLIADTSTTLSRNL